VCSKVGECAIVGDNILESYLNVPDATSCHQFCRNNSECNFFTYFSVDHMFQHMCLIFSSCEVLDKTCEGCIYGPKICETCDFDETVDGECITDEETTSTSTPSQTSTSPPTETPSPTTSTTTTTPHPAIDCEAVCLDYPDNVFGTDGCCRDSYCWCGGDANIEMTCTPPGNVFCLKHDACIKPENCQSDKDCCEITTTTTLPPDEMCDKLCEGAGYGEIEVPEPCCKYLYACYCMNGAPSSPMTCSNEGASWCPETEKCVDSSTCNLDDCCPQSPYLYQEQEAEVDRHISARDSSQKNKEVKEEFEFSSIKIEERDPSTELSQDIGVKSN